MPPITRSKASPTAHPAVSKPATGKSKKSKVTKKQSPAPTTNSAKVSKAKKPNLPKKRNKKKASSIAKPKPKKKPSPPSNSQLPTNLLAPPLNGGEDWELTESYRILPYLESSDFMAAYSRGLGMSSSNNKCRDKTPKKQQEQDRTTRAAAKPQRNSPPRLRKTNPQLPIPPTPPHSATLRPSVHFAEPKPEPKPEQKLKRSSSISHSSPSPNLAGIPSYAPAPAEEIERNWQNIFADMVHLPPQLPSNPAQPAAAPPTPKKRRGRPRKHSIATSQPETPVSIQPARAFNRPTVASLRRERAQWHQEIGEWVGKVKGAMGVLESVVGELEGRMRVLVAVNRVQAPLRKAVLRDGRGRGRKRKA